MIEYSPAMDEYTIFGSPISLFTRKLEAAMQFYGAPFRSERKTDANRESIESRSGTHQVPVLLTPENWMLGDTTPILALLDGRFPSRRLFPTGPLGVLVHILEDVLDEWVARTMVHYRWHYDDNTVAVVRELTGRDVTIGEARQFPLATWGLRACRATGTESAAQQRAAEQEYLGILAALETQLGETQYALGDRPTAVDAILLGGLRGHTNRDPLPDLTRFERVLRWERNAVAPCARGDDLPDFPATTPFAEHLLGLARACYRPFMLGNARAAAAGDKAFVATIYGEDVSYLCRAYPERARRMICHRIENELRATERNVVREWLAAVGLADCYSATPG